MYNNKLIGNFGEDLACQFLCKNGYRIIARNFQAKYKEIDIIAEIGDLLVFIEVKTRTNCAYGSADEALCEQKFEFFLKAVNYYLNSKNIVHDNIRMDFIAIDIRKLKKSAKIQHFKDLF